MSIFYFKLNLPVCILHSGRYALKFKFDAANPPPPPLLSLQILKYDVFGFDRVTLENEISPNLEKSSKVDTNTKLAGKQACQACNCLLFFEDKEEPQPNIIFIIEIIARC